MFGGTHRFLVSWVSITLPSLYPNVWYNMGMRQLSVIGYNARCFIMVSLNFFAIAILGREPIPLGRLNFTTVSAWGLSSLVKHFSLNSSEI